MYPKYSPLEDRVLIRPLVEKEERTESGIVIPLTVTNPVKKGVVVSCGQGRYAIETGLPIPTCLCKGDVVLYGAESGIEIIIEKEDGSGKESVWIMRETDVFLLISKK